MSATPTLKPNFTVVKSPPQDTPVVASLEHRKEEAVQVTIDQPEANMEHHSKTTHFETFFRSLEELSHRIVKNPLVSAVRSIATTSATYPIATIASSVLVAVFCLSVGLTTNFYIETDGDVLWTPIGSRTVQHGRWVEEDSGFEPYGRNIRFLIHSDGENVLTLEGASCLFDVIEGIRAAEGYSRACELSFGDRECPLISATTLFQHNRTLFEAMTSVDADVPRLMSPLFDRNGDPVIRSLIFGSSEPPLPENMTSFADYDPALLSLASSVAQNSDDWTFNGVSKESIQLKSALSYTGDIPLSPDGSITEDLELEVTNLVYGLNDVWAEQGIQCTGEVYTIRAFDDEILRGLQEDLP